MDIETSTNTRLVLASASARRAELMKQAGYTFDIVPSPLDEPDTMGVDVPPVAQAEALSYFKARSVLCQVGDGLIVAADTLVAGGGRIFGKPAGIIEAKETLEALSATTHEVITGVTLLDAVSRRRLISHDRTVVKMRPIPPAALKQYLNSGAWLGKAGAYGIQDSGDAFIERIEGSFTNVVGMPMELLAKMLKEWGYSPIPVTKAQTESV